MSVPQVFVSHERQDTRQLRSNVPAGQREVDAVGRRDISKRFRTKTALHHRTPPASEAAWSSLHSRPTAASRNCDNLSFEPKPAHCSRVLQLHTIFRWTQALSILHCEHIFRHHPSWANLDSKGTAPQVVQQHKSNAPASNSMTNSPTICWTSAELSTSIVRGNTSRRHTAEA